MKWALVLPLVLLATAAEAQTSTKWVGKYFCKASAAGGVAYEAQQKAWKATTFVARAQFIVSVKVIPLEDQRKSDRLGGYGQYEVTLAELGDTQTPTRCRPDGHWRSDDKTPVIAYDEGLLTCTATLSTFKMSLGAMRYMSAYLQGFVDGEDNNDNTRMSRSGHALLSSSGGRG